VEGSVNNPVNAWNFGKQLHVRLLQGGQQLVLVQLLEKDGYKENQMGFNIVKGLDYHRHGRQFSQDGYMNTGGQGKQKVEGTTIGMSQGKQGYHSITRIEFNGTHGEIHISCQGIGRKHHTLAKTGGSRGIVNLCQFIIVHFCKDDVLFLESFRVFLCKALIQSVESLFQLR